MKRTKKTLIGLLLSVMLVLGLIPTMAFADEQGTQEPEPANNTFKFKVTKEVDKDGTAEAPYQAFYFELEGQDGKDLTDYGIDYEANDNAIETNGASSYNRILTGKINPEKLDAWEFHETDGTYTCQLTLRERINNLPNWTYDPTSYTLTLTYSDRIVQTSISKE